MPACLGQGTGHTQPVAVCLDHWLRAQLSWTPIWESCRARINQCLMCLFDTPSAGMKQVLVPDSKTKNAQLALAYLLQCPRGCFLQDVVTEQPTQGKILNMNFWSHRGASAAHSDAMQHFSPERITTGANDKGPSLRIRGEEYQPNKIKSWKHMQTENIDENNLVQDRKYLLDEPLISIIQYFYPCFHGNSTCVMMLSCKGWVDAHILLYLCEFFSWPPATLNKPVKLQFWGQLDGRFVKAFKVREKWSCKFSS